MKLPLIHPFTATTALGLVLTCSPLSAESPGDGQAQATTTNLRAHEWGTFTTLHWPSGYGLPWYQSARGRTFGQSGNVSDLPAFVHGNVFFKAGALVTARMETPVIYFYTDREQAVDISVNYSSGRITEFYPGTGSAFNQWKGLELIPPADNGDLAKQLPIDPKRPDNHYYEARAVPEAAYVRQVQPADEEGKRAPAEVEKFVFYRGAGVFDARLSARLGAGGELTLENYNTEFAIDHVWVLQTTADAVRWEKLPAFATCDPDAPRPATVIKLGDLDAGSSRKASIHGLEASMMDALIEAGLSSPEAAAMVATWDEQWYEEPGQRVFSIPPQALIDRVLPLKISPKPAETVRVFVHRAEILSPETVQSLEEAMTPGALAERTRKLIQQAQLGRFVHGAIHAVAADVGRRVTADYRTRGLTGLVEPKDPTAAAR